MKLRTIAAILATLVGIGVGAKTYQHVAASSTDVSPAAHTTDLNGQKAAQVKVPKIVPATRFEWAPCKPPAVQKGKSCVTEVVQTIVLPSSSGSTSSGGGHQASGSGGHTSSGGHDSGGDDTTPEPSDPPSEPGDNGGNNGGDEPGND